MAPHRVGLFGSTIRQAMSPPEPAAGVAAGLLALATSFWNLHVVALLLLAIAGGVIDLWTGARRALIKRRLGHDGAFDRAVLDQGIGGKTAALVVILFIGVAVDSLVAIAGGAAHLGIGSIFATWTPVTAGMLAYRVAREASSVIANLEGTPGGDDAIWPGAKRVIDTIRYRMAHPDAAEDAFPHQRWDDQVTREEAIWLAKQLGEYRAAAALPPPPTSRTSKSEG